MKHSYVKEFFFRGMMFGGFGPIILGIVYAILQYTVEGFSLSGPEVLIAIISTYLLAFVQAGASVCNQIEEWPITKSLFLHFSLLYLAYVVCYLVNTWIPFEWTVILVFTAIFVLVYFVIWVTVWLCVHATIKRLNRNLPQ